MNVSSKPSLRNFAVLDRVFRGKQGTIWKVQDRRNLTRNQFLFLPSRLKAWPLWLSRLEDFTPTPTKLRSGKIGIILCSDTDQILLNSIKKSRQFGSVRLNPLIGFVVENKKSKLAWSLLPALALVILFVVAVPKAQSVAIPTIDSAVPSQPKLSCSREVEVGSEIVGPLKRFRGISIADVDFRIANYKIIGGLTRLQVRRTCDRKLLNIDAWMQEKQLLVEKVY